MEYLTHDIYVHRDREVENENLAGESPDRLSDRIKSRHLESVMREIDGEVRGRDYFSVRVVSLRARHSPKY